jgi:pimeloyl-ACP methyl ester carboxylesterase
MRTRRLSFLPLLLLLGCATQQPDLVRLYGNRQGPIDQPPVIIIHGALGGRLSNSETGEEAWPGAFNTLIFSNYAHLELDIDPATLTPKTSSLQPSGIAEVIGGVDFYGRILRVLKEAGGYVESTPGIANGALERRYYTFSYDWRLDIVDSARRLDAFIEQIRIDYGDPDLEVDIVAHSLGGLITRYYARYGTEDVLDGNDFPVTQAGAQKIRRVALLGVPNLGSTDALRTLMRGYKVIFGTIPTEVVATFPSTYQVLPHAIIDWFVTASGKPLDRDQFDYNFWRLFNFSVFDPLVEERIFERYEDPEEAKEHLELLGQFFRKSLERARRFSWSLTVPIEEPKLRYVVFGGSCDATPARIVVEEVDGVSTVRLFPGEIKNPLPDIDYETLMLEPGDGVVTKASLLARQTFDPTVARHKYSFFPLDYAMFLCESHASLTGNIDFQNNLLHALLSVDL